MKAHTNPTLIDATPSPTRRESGAPTGVTAGAVHPPIAQAQMATPRLAQPQPAALRRIDPEEVRFFAGRSHVGLAQGIADYLRVPLEPSHFLRFANDNMCIQLGASVRGRSVFVIQSLTPPVSDHLVELLMMLDIARSAAAHEVHAVIPYFSYARSDKKDAPRISIAARLVADLLVTAGATHVMTMQLHSPQVHGFFSVPTDPLTARGLIVDHLRSRFLGSADTIVVAPDAGGAKSAARFASQLHLPVAVASKTRISDTEVRINEELGKQVTGYKRAIAYDDEIGTGGTAVELCKQLIRDGIEEIVVACTHGLFLGRAIQELAAISEISEVITTDTTPLPPERQLAKMKVLSVAPIFGEAIRRNHLRQSIGDLFSFWDEDE